MKTVALLVVAGWLSCSLAQKVNFASVASLKLADYNNETAFGRGVATAGAYDAEMKFLYVIGTEGDVLNIISLVDPMNPQVIRRVPYDNFVDGYPDAVAVCRSSVTNRAVLAISFEKLLNPTLKAFVRIYNLLDGPLDELVPIFERINLDGVDPTGVAFTSGCETMVVVQQGRVAQNLARVFIDSLPHIDVFNFVGSNEPSRTAVVINEQALADANIRWVLRQCEDNPAITSGRVRDLEPRDVTIDDNNVAYISFTKNNAMGKVDLTAQPLTLQITNLGTKDWRPFNIDTNDNDAVSPGNYPINTFWQPLGLGYFNHDGKTYIISADAGEVKRLYVDDGCLFEESLSGKDWIASQVFSSRISASDVAALRAAMQEGGPLENFRFTHVKGASDGYYATDGGYDYVTGYGGRGISIMSSDFAHIDQSKDDIERIFTDPQNNGVTESELATFNAGYGTPSEIPSSRIDEMSTSTGATLRAMAVGEIDNILVAVTANGVVGGLYGLTISRTLNGEPFINDASVSFTRTGEAGDTWNNLYASSDPFAVGEPQTKNIVWLGNITSPSTEAFIAVLGNYAGAVNIYKLTIG